MNGIDRLHGIAEDVGRTVWLRDLGAALSDIADGIEGGTRDLGGYESDVLAWVEKNGGLEAVKERTMPEGMSWPFYEHGEPVRIGGYWQQDGFDESVTYVDSISFAEDGVRLENEYHEVFYRYGERVKWPAPKVIAADGEPLEVGQTVWDVDSGIEYEVVGIHIDEDNPVRVMRTDGSHLAKAAKPKTLTHQRPVLDADGVPIHEGDTAWLTGEPEYSWTVTHVSERHVGGYCNEDGSDLDMHSKSLTHTKPEPDSWSSVWADVSNGNESPEGMMRRCRALAERGQ